MMMMMVQMMRMMMMMLMMLRTMMLRMMILRMSLWVHIQKNNLLRHLRDSSVGAEKRESNKT
jgi:hypothetical protein